MENKIYENAYAVEHHDKKRDDVYSLVPLAMCGILKILEPIEGFVIGGSYAKGTYKFGDDIAFDVLLENECKMQDVSDFLAYIEEEFNIRNIVPDIHAVLSRSSVDARLRKSIYSRHPNTPFVTRTFDVAQEWGLLFQPRAQD
ncbi:MAG: hypothetical protein NUV98_01560 [Candidatus Roizmanbacteria bacterium]|nr:hypothetical protein [Candidatus Roizmanbacteria bacterium]